MSKGLRGAVVVSGTVALALALAACGNAKAATETTQKLGASLPSTGKSPGVTSNSDQRRNARHRDRFARTRFRRDRERGPGLLRLDQLAGRRRRPQDRTSRTRRTTAVAPPTTRPRRRPWWSRTTCSQSSQSAHRSSRARRTLLRPALPPSAMWSPRTGTSTRTCSVHTARISTTTPRSRPPVSSPTRCMPSQWRSSPTASAPHRQPCADIGKGVTKFGFHLGFEDLNFGIGASPTADVQKMKAAGVDLVFSCMEGTDNLAFSEAMHQFGMTTHFVWLNGYSQQVIKANAYRHERSPVRRAARPLRGRDAIPRHVPRSPAVLHDDAEVLPAVPLRRHRDAGLDLRGAVRGGLKAIAPNFTQNRLVDAINQETAYQRGWARATAQLDDFAYLGDTAVLRGLRRGRERQDLRLSSAKGSSVFVCLGANSDKAMPNPPNTPGG